MKRIKELELSIASLDDQLERFEIEKMNCKTREVKKRMSIATSTWRSSAWLGKRQTGSLATCVVGGALDATTCTARGIPHAGPL